MPLLAGQTNDQAILVCWSSVCPEVKLLLSEGTRVTMRSSTGIHDLRFCQGRKLAEQALIGCEETSISLSLNCPLSLIHYCNSNLFKY